MRGQLQQRTPAQLLWIIAASSALVVTGSGVLSLTSWRHRGEHPFFWPSFAAVALGLIYSKFAEQLMRDGINSDHWPDSLLAGPRKFTSHPAYLVLIGLLLVGIVACMVTLRPDLLGGYWMLLVPAITLIRVRSYLHPEPSNSLIQPLERSKPLQSENWGTASRPSSSRSAS